MKGRHRAKPSPRVANGWLGAGALTLGLGAALASGTGMAHADGTTSDASSSASSPSSGTGASSGPSSPARGADESRTASPGGSSRSPRATTSDTDAETGTSTRGGRTTPSAALEPSPSRPDVIVLTRTTPPDAIPVVGRPTPLARHVVDEVRAAGHGIADREGPRPGTGSPKSAAGSISAPAPSVTAAVTSQPTPSSSTRTAVASGAVAVVTPAGALAAPSLPADPITGLLTEVFSALNTLIVPNPAVPPANPLHLLVFEVVRRFEVTFGLPVIGTVPASTSDPVIGTNPVSTAPAAPRPGDVVQTPYGAIGKWLLQPDGQISTFGGQSLGGKTLLEPINVIILDPTSTTTTQAVTKLNAELSLAGFPAQPVHTGGFQAIVDGIAYGQQPTGLLQAFSDDFFLLPDDHARAFGPDPIPAPDGMGYVWTVAVSREQLGLFNFLPTHTYLSYDAGRDALAGRLVLGGATLVGILALSNSYDDATETTGDHDGYAVVVQLND